jgi:hypothetical protein
MRPVLFAAIVLLCASCGGGSPSGPSAPSVPSVAGNYSGTTTFTYPLVPLSFTCNSSTIVTQSGATVSMAPLTLTGSSTCTSLAIHIGQFIIDSTGAIPAHTSGTFNDPSCGTYSYSASGGFFGRQFSLELVANSATCSVRLTSTMNKA